MIRKIEAYVLCPKQEQSFFFSQWTYEEEILSRKNRNRTRRFGGGEGNEPNPERGTSISALKKIISVSESNLNGRLK
jgi:hypothetical protein